MFKRLKKITLSTVFALVVALTGAAPGISAAGATAPRYVALGDSVAYGMSAYTPDGSIYGYTNMYYDYLNKKVPFTTKGVFTTNFSVPGAYSYELLTQANNHINDVSTATVITINIGGMNLLTPFISAAFTMYGIPVSGTIDTEYADLYNAISKDPNAVARYSQLAKSAYLDAALNMGTQAFITGNVVVNGTPAHVPSWSETIGQVRLANGSAKIYVNKLYNPLPKTDPLYATIDKYIQKINSEIVAGSQGGNVYKVVDVYSAVNAPGTCNFNPVSAILIARSHSSLDLFKLSLDIHPTFYGHSLIYSKLIKTN
ncbi:MAG: GDSL-type esterase/lipase family protein [Clostridiaceae bacterium]